MCNQLGCFCSIVLQGGRIYILRVVRPELALQFARGHEARLWQCLSRILGMPENLCDETTRHAATLPLALGGLGLRSAERSRVAAHWASWADTLPMIQGRHPAVAELIIGSLQGGPNSPCLVAVQNAALELDGVEGFEVPEWPALAGGLRPEPREPELHEPGGQRAGWQHEAASRVERHFRAEHILAHLTLTRRAMLRSQSGPVAGIPFSVAPSSFLTRLEPALFRVLLQRRLSLPLPLSKRSCRCGRLLDAFGHHRAACSRSEVLGRRGFSLESAAARVCREAGWARGNQTSSCAIWTSGCRMLMTAEGSRWWSTVGHSSEVCSWQWTPLWCLRCREMANHSEGHQTETSWLSNVLGGRRRPHTPSLCDQAVEHAWWFWPWRLEAGGLRKPGPLCSCWRKHGRGRSHL